MEDNNWYIRKDGKIRGPFPHESMLKMAESGVVDSATEISQDKRYFAAASEFKWFAPFLPVVETPEEKSVASEYKVAVDDPDVRESSEAPSGLDYESDREDRDPYYRKVFACPECDARYSQEDLDNEIPVIVDGFAYCPQCEPSKHCPYCGEEIKSTAAKCKHCGEWVKKKKRKRAPDRTHRSRYDRDRYSRGRVSNRYRYAEQDTVPASWWVLGLLFPIIGQVLGIVAVAQGKQNGVLFLLVALIVAPILWVFLAFTACAGCLGLVAETGSTINDNNVSPEQGNFTEAVPNLRSRTPQKTVLITNINHKVDNLLDKEYMTVFGTVKNTGSKPISIVTLKVVFYNSSDKIIGTSPAVVSNLRPGESKTWETIAFDEGSKVSRYATELDYGF